GGQPAVPRVEDVAVGVALRRVLELAVGGRGPQAVENGDRAGGRGRVERARDGEAHVLQAGDRLSTVRAERRGFGQVAGARKTGNAVAEGRQVAEHTVLVID